MTERSRLTARGCGLPSLGFFFAVAAVLAAWPVSVDAQEPDAPVPVISIRDGAEALALFAPYKVGHVITAGWYISGIRIPATSIEVSLASVEGKSGMIRLFPPEPDLGGERSKNFQFQRSMSLVHGGGRAAADALVEALRINDRDSPWVDPVHGTLSQRGVRMRQLDRHGRTASERARAQAGVVERAREVHLEWDREVDEAALSEWERSRGATSLVGSLSTFSYLERISRGLDARRFLFEQMSEGLSTPERIEWAVTLAIEEGILPWLVLICLLAALAAAALRGRPRLRWAAAGAVVVVGLGLFPYLDEPSRIPRDFMLVLQDGVVTLILIAGALAVFTARRLRDRPPWVGWFLLGILVVGAALRVLLSEPLLMTAWPYARFHTIARAVYTGPVLSYLTWSTGATVSMTGVLHTTTLVLGILAPWAVFLHAHHLTGNDRAALGAAALLAVLPAHLRFSASDVAFIPSIVMSALTLVLTHVALYDTSRRWRIAALVILPMALRFLVVMRPLNMVFLLVVAGVIFLLRPGAAPLRRRWLVAAVSLGPGLLGVAAHFIGKGFGDQAGEGLTLSTIRRGFLQLVDPVQNTLVNPSITPPLFGLAVLVGAIILLRTQRRLGIFLLAWLGVFFFAHGYVVPWAPAMTARYHLHLTVPFVILGGAAAPFILRRAGRWAAPILVVVIASAGLHYGFVRDMSFTEMQEYRFVRAAAQEIPDGCWAMEAVETKGVPHRSRLRRVVSELSRGDLRRRNSLILVDPEDPTLLRVLHAEGRDRVEELDLELLLEDPPSCLYFYQGLKCRALREAGEELGSGCEPPDLGAPPVTVAAEGHLFRFYDENNQPSFWTSTDLFRPTLLRLPGGPGDSEEHWWEAGPAVREDANVHHWTKLDWNELEVALRFFEYRILQILLLGLALLGLVLLLRGWPRLQRIPRTDRWLLFGALVAAVLLRALWAEPAMIHENYCGVGRLACAATPPCTWVTGNHGAASFAGYNLIMGLTGGTDAGVQAANVVLMAVVQLLLLFALVRDATGSPRAGALAAWSLAMLPVHVRMSPTESFFPLALTLLLASVLALRAFATRPDIPRAILAGVLVAITVETSRVYNLVAILGLGVYLLALFRGGRVRIWPLVAAAGTFALLTVGHYVGTFSGFVSARGYLPADLGDYLEAMTANNLFLDLGLTPLVLLLAWPIGGLLALRRGPRRGGWDLLLLFLGFGLVFTMSDPLDETWPTRIRMQMNLAPFIAAMAGAALHAASRRPVGRLVIAGLVVASLWQIPAHTTVVREVLVPTLEAQYLSRTIPSLPSMDVLVTVDQTLPIDADPARGDPVETHFPFHILWRDQGLPVERVSLSRLIQQPERYVGQRIVFYLSTTASVRLPEETAGPGEGLRPEVAAALDGVVLTPIEGATGSIPMVNPDRVRNHFFGDEIPVGFYWLEFKTLGGSGPAAGDDPPARGS